MSQAGFFDFDDRLDQLNQHGKATIGLRNLTYNLDRYASLVAT